MLPIDFPGSNIVIKTTATNDKAIDGVPGFFGLDKDDNYYFLIQWMPNREDLIAMNAGKPIIMKIYAISAPSIALFTLDNNAKPNQ